MFGTGTKGPSRTGTDACRGSAGILAARTGTMLTLAPVCNTTGTIDLIWSEPKPCFLLVYSISLKDERLDIKEWSKVMNACSQPIGDNMNVRRPQVEDRWISILHYKDGPVY